MKADSNPPFLKPGFHGCTHFLERDGKNISIVCIKRDNKRSKHEINGLLVHEAMHVWRRTLEVMGEDNPSLEFEAYAMQNISQGLMQAYWKPVTCKPKGKVK